MRLLATNDMVVKLNLCNRVQCSKSHAVCTGVISTRRQAAAEAERRRGEDAEDISSAHMAEATSQVSNSITVASMLHEHV